MGGNKNRRDAFGRWYQARGKGQQYLLCLIPVVVAIVAMKLIIPLLPEQEQQSAHGPLHVHCGGVLTAILERDDPRVLWALENQSLEGICPAP
ncbi:hypothetical protein [uncultured Mycolicibacterium sp.]|uniref:hypothetical protein n=1 Tax=uncultured Mycolicibacterium sp. TaxID=2320817 RepID=UPI0032B1F28F